MTSVNVSVEAFVNRLADLRFDDVFNPYADACHYHDEANAPAIRRRNLSLVLEAALSSGVDSLWIARDLGYRGGRRTGLALTDEAHLAAHARLFSAPPLVRATRGPAITERTATVIWQALGTIRRPIFLWNVFPLHPHERNDPMSNRPHSRLERQACRPILMWLLDHLQPKSILAIGRDAQQALADLDVKSLQVRHPSYGGQTEFLSGTYAHYGLKQPPQPETNWLI
ncbi:uracil-DNA glycosylase [Inquilinus limosus]|uniref:uracil-DNA glycosylase n=1 Tax=Inquilinus limosus TaxID=171674 RepID=UPI0009DEBCDB|nr:uracil-DNA glycosylase [Inquilinus limosus]